MLKRSGNKPNERTGGETEGGKEKGKQRTRRKEREGKIWTHEGVQTEKMERKNAF